MPALPCRSWQHRVAGVIDVLCCKESGDLIYDVLLMWLSASCCATEGQMSARHHATCCRCCCSMQLCFCMLIVLLWVESRAGPSRAGSSRVDLLI